MPLTEYAWFPEVSEQRALHLIGEGWEPVMATEMPTLAEQGHEVIRNGDLGLYKRVIEE